MPITNTNVTVNCSGNAGTTGGTATAITPLVPTLGSLQDPMPVTVYNPGTAPVFVGGPAVVSGNGIAINPGGSADFSLTQGDILYAICNTVTTSVSVLKMRQ